MKETWIDIKGYEGLYEVSDLGRIRTKEGKVTYTERHGQRKWKQRIMKFRGYTPKTGYRISLWKDGVFKEFLVARLVAFNFFDHDINDRKLTVNHIDGNRMNNNLSNLELTTIKENIQHAFNSGLMPQRKVTIKRLSDNKILEFRSMALAERKLGIRKGILFECLKENKSIQGYEILNIGEYKKEKEIKYEN